MEVAPAFSRLVPDTPRRHLRFVDSCSTCKSMHCPRCQQRHMLGTCAGHIRVPTTKKIQSAAESRRGLSFPKLVKEPTLGRAPTTLQQTCFAAATQAHQKAAQLSHPADHNAIIDKQQAGLAQVLMCNSKTLPSVVCMPSCCSWACSLLTAAALGDSL